MRIIVLNALFAFIFCVGVMIVGRAVDQVHRDANCITATSNCTQTP